MKEELYREKNRHGSAFFPFQCYEFKVEESQVIKNYHWHEEVEWIYVISGTVIIEIDMLIYKATDHTLICIPKEALHKITVEKYANYYAFVYQFQMLQFSQYDYCESEYMVPLENGQMLIAKIIALQEQKNKQLELELEQIVDSYTLKPGAWQLLIKASLLKIVAYLMEGNLVEQPNSPIHKVEKVENMKRLLTYIRDHYTEKIYIKELATIVTMNETYFCRYFKEALGKTPIEYINGLRIEEAARRIRETDTQITEICYMVGFENVSYFIRKFKERKGITPKKYSTLIKISTEN